MPRHEYLSVGHLHVDMITGGGGFLNQFPGDKVYLDPVNGSDGNDGYSPAQAKKTFDTAFDMLTTNQNDCLVMIGGASANVLTEGITWNKSYTHLFGVVAPTGFGIRNRIQTVTVGVSPLFDLTGNGCIIQDVLITQEGSHATSNAIALRVTGARNWLCNVQARTLGALAVVDASKRDLVIASSNGENTFVDCVLGSDTYDGSADAANYVLEFNGANQTARNKFIRCDFLGSGSAGACWILATTVSCLSSYQKFVDCFFWNNTNGTMNAMTQGFNINTNAGGQIVLIDPEIYGCTNLETTDSGLLIGTNVPAAATTGKMLALTW